MDDERLKIKKIDQYEKDSEDFKADSIIYGIIGAVVTLIGLIKLKMSYKEILLLSPAYILPLLAFILAKKNADRKIKKLKKTDSK